ncbi:hypothetical protein M9H77_06552 [Catharanthus roseus]|uniref:Uncharacterized protein n=1 Tax=Catharanthus roseus TaxID=4058 RepID=A0ACC0BSP4_CATRO|nr:hypothetical protein M9H77_06552 [Catharanthus roseus]
MPRCGPYKIAAAQHLVSLGSSLFPPAAIVHSGGKHFLLFLQQVVSESRFGSSAPAPIDDTRSEGTVEFSDQIWPQFYSFLSKLFFKSFIFLSHLITFICLQNMSVPKLRLISFDGKSDFVMWQRKMKAVLVQNKIAPAICSPKECPEFWKEGHMKNKCFKRIRDEKQCKHGKGSNKTHVLIQMREREIEREREGVAPVTLIIVEPLLGILSLSAYHRSRRRLLSATANNFVCFPFTFLF